MDVDDVIVVGEALEPTHKRDISVTDPLSPPAPPLPLPGAAEGAIRHNTTTALSHKEPHALTNTSLENRIETKTRIKIMIRIGIESRNKKGMMVNGVTGRRKRREMQSIALEVAEKREGNDDSLSKSSGYVSVVYMFHDGGFRGAFSKARVAWRGPRKTARAAVTRQPDQKVTRPRQLYTRCLDPLTQQRPRSATRKFGYSHDELFQIAHF
ncbi:hypothetical protein EVAR_14471_1 [Eumeta japonica]|uniref:Uncharacterized protein n=1 Tax=Eumeta variegata TaxID=151549 RepID=A0A4C1U4J3_EUMVA|nr:hypothetical protein EVAR_14471_1 [Eumeta japonica]